MTRALAAQARTRLPGVSSGLMHYDSSMEDVVRYYLKTLHRLCLALVLVLAATTAFAQAQAPAQLETTLKKMLTALQANSLRDFVAEGDASFKSGMTQDMLAGVSSQFAPRLSRGYTTTLLGTLNQHGYTVYLWKLVFKDGQDDLLVTMAVKDGKVAGFFLH